MLPGRVIPFAEPSGNLSAGDTRQQSPVIQIGRDQRLLQLRARLIRSAGFPVRSLFPEELTAQLPTLHPGKVWIFCHTLHFYELALLSVAIRSNSPSDKLLRLTGLDDATQIPGFFDELLEPTDGVDELLRAVGRLMRESTATQRV